MKAGAFLLMHEAKKESRDLITALSWIGDAWEDRAYQVFMHLAWHSLTLTGDQRSEAAPTAAASASTMDCVSLRIPMMPDGYSDAKPDRHSNLMPDTVPI